MLTIGVAQSMAAPYREVAPTAFPLLVACFLFMYGLYQAVWRGLFKQRRRLASVGFFIVVLCLISFPRTFVLGQVCGFLLLLGYWLSRGLFRDRPWPSPKRLRPPGRRNRRVKYGPWPA